MSHATIQEAMVAILADMPAVGKNQRAPQQMGGYAFRGIDDVLNALNPLLAKHGVFFVPNVLERIDGQFTNAKGNITWTVKLLVSYQFCHNVDRTELQTIVWGEAHDSGDKATQKALTAAQKSMLFQVFAINTADQADSDSERHEVEEAVPERPYISGMNVSAFLARCAEYGADDSTEQAIVFKATDGRTTEAAQVYADEVATLRAAFEEWRKFTLADLTKPGAALSVPPGEDKVKPGKTVPKRPLPQTEGITDVHTDGTLV